MLTREIKQGVLPNGNVAVKRIKNSHSINETVFYREVDSLLNIEHKNVVRFLGLCASTDQTAIQIEGSKQHIYAEIRERLLCFEYISNGSLQEHITGLSILHVMELLSLLIVYLFRSLLPFVLDDTTSLHQYECLLL